MRTQIRLTDSLESYITEISPEEPKVLAEIRRETSSEPLHLMQIPPEQGHFLSVLLKSLNVRRTLEIGVFTGYSLVATALAVGAEGECIGVDIDEQWCRTAMRYCERAGVADRVDIRTGDAKKILQRMIEVENAGGTFDFVFIDADKEGYRDYYEMSLQLLKPGGMLVVDNVLWHGAVVDEAAQDSETKAIREFNRIPGADSRVDACVIPVADGMILARKR